MHKQKVVYKYWYAHSGMMQSVHTHSRLGRCVPICGMYLYSGPTLPQAAQIRHPVDVLSWLNLDPSQPPRL